MAPSIFIAIAGGAASGKKTVQAALKSTLLSLHTGSADTLTIETLHQRDFRHASSSTALDPDSLETYDLDLLATHISCSTSTVVIAEGTYLLTHPGLLSLATVKVFVDSDADVRLARRVLSLPATELQETLKAHVAFGKRNYEAVVAPTKQVADIILPDGGGREGETRNGVLLIAGGVMDDIVKVVGARAGLVGRAKSYEGKEAKEAKGVLCEADLTMGMPTYYETV